MANDLVHVLLEVAAETHPFTRERFGQLVSRLGESAPGPALAGMEGLAGPRGEAAEWVASWLSGVGESTRAGEVAPALRRHLADWAAGQTEAARFLPHWGATLQVQVGREWRPAMRLTLAESWDAAAAYAVRSEQVARLGMGAGELGRRTAQAFQRILPTLETERGFSDFGALERRITELFQRWSREVAGAHPVAQEVAFIRAFLKHLAPLHAGDDRFWHGLIEGALGASIESALAGVSSHPLADALVVLAESSGRFEPFLNLLQEAPHLLSGGQPVTEALEWVMLFQLVADVAEVGLRERWRMSLARNAVDSELAGPLGELSSQRGILAEWLRPRYERSVVDWLESGLDYFVGLVEAARSIDSGLATAREEFQRLGDDLAVGQVGQNAASRMASLAAELVARAAWLGSLTPNPKVTLGQFRRALVADLGLDVGEESWKRHSQLQAGILRIVDSAGGPLKAGRALLGQVDLVAPATRLRPGDIVLSAAARERLDPEGAGLPADAPEWFLMRIALDFRLGTERTLAQLTCAWLSSQLLPATGGRQGGLVRSVLAETVMSARAANEDDKLPEGWKRAADAVVQELPRLTAGQALPHGAGTIAAETAAQVFRNHPEWTLGDAEGAERRGAERMEAMLRRAAQVLEPASGLDSGWLAGWWAKDLGAKAAQDPTEQHEETLQALNRALGRHLTADEATRVFDLVHDTYREVLGVSVAAAALGSKALTLEGPLFREVLQASERIDAELLPGADALAAAAGAAGPVGAEVVRQATVLVRQFALSGDVEAAWQRVMPLLDTWLEGTPTEEAATGWMALTQSLVLAAPTAKRPLWLALLAPGAEIVGNIGLGRRLMEAADSYGAFAAGAAQRMLARHFEVAEGRDAERALAEQLSGIAESMGRRLREDSPELATINILRRPLELMLTHGKWDSLAWDFAVQALFRFYGMRLDAAERAAAGRLQARLGGAWRQLPEFRPMVETIFGSSEYAFSARPDEEQTIRMAVSALAAALLAGREQAGGGRSAIVRFALATELPRFREGAKLEAVFSLIGTIVEGNEPHGLAAILIHARDVFRQLQAYRGNVSSIPGAALLATLGGDPARAWVGLQLAADDARQLAWGRAMGKVDGLVAPAVTPLATAAASAEIVDQGPAGNAARLALALLATLQGEGDMLQGRRLAARVASLDPELAKAEDPGIAQLAQALPQWKAGQTGYLQGWAGVRLGARLAGDAADLVAAADGEMSAFVLDPAFGGFDPVRSDFDHLLRQFAAALGDPDTARPGLPLVGLAASQCACAATAWRCAAWLHGIGRERAGSPEERKVLAACWEEVVVANRTCDSLPDWLHAGTAAVPGWIKRMADARADLAAGMGAAGGGDEIAAEVAIQLDLILGSLAAGGDADSWVEAVRPALDLALERTPAKNLLAAWRAFGGVAGKVLGPAWMPWGATLGAAMAQAVAEVAAGREWQEQAETLAGAARNRLPARGPEALPEVRELLAAIIDVAGLHLRLHAHVAAAAAAARFGAVALGGLGEAPRPTWLANGRIVAEAIARIDGPQAVRSAARRAAERLAELWPAVPGWRPALGYWTRGSGPWIGDGVSSATVLDVAAAGLLGDRSPVSGKAVLQRLILRDRAWVATAARDWAALTAAWLEAWNEGANKALPAAVARRISEIPRLIENLERTRNVSGFPHGLGCALRSLSPGARAQWGASLIARAHPESGLGTPEPVDLAVGQLTEWVVPEDQEVVLRWKMLDAVAGMADSLAPAAPKEEEKSSGGFLSSLLGRRKPKESGPVIDPAKYRSEAYGLLVRLAGAVAADEEVVGISWLAEETAAVRGGSTEAQMRADYHLGVAEALAEAFGARHSLAVAYRTAAAKVPAATLLWLVEAEGGGLAERLLKAMPGAGLAEVTSLLHPLAAHGAGLVPAEAGEGIGHAIRVGDRSILVAATSQLEPIKGVLRANLAPGECTAFESSLQSLRQVAVG